MRQVSELSPGAAAACERIDGLVRAAGDELGRWMLLTARSLALAAGRRRRPFAARQLARMRARR